MTLPACENNPGGDLLSHRVSPAVPWALEDLTSEFEMGSGVAPPVWPPEIFWCLEYENEFRMPELLPTSIQVVLVHRASTSTY